MNKKQREAITQAWSIIDRAVGHSLNSSARMLWRDLNKATLEHEKAHRAMGRRFTDGRAGYKESATLTAKFFAVRAVVRPYRPKGLRDRADVAKDTAGIDMYSAILRDFANLRDDILKGAMLHACFMDEAPKNTAVSRLLESAFELEGEIAGIDYVTDVAA